MSTPLSPKREVAPRPLLLGYLDNTRVDEVVSANPIIVWNPFDDSIVGYAPDLSEAELQSRISRLVEAQNGWIAQTAEYRANRLKSLHRMILQRTDELARLVTLESGKPLHEAQAEVRYAAGYVEWFAEEARRVYGDIVPSPWDRTQIRTLLQPVGVVAAITPWNFPLAMITRKVAPALAAGCSIIVKPAEETPLSALALQEIAEEAGIPSSLYSTFTCRDASMFGDIVCAHPQISKITFTGSTPVGVELLRKSASTVKRTSMELGGNAPFIVFEDADLDAAVNGLLKAKFRNAGQTCISPNRLLVQSSVRNEFLSRLTEKLFVMRSGNGLDAETELGPVISQSSYDRLQSLLKRASAGGAEIVEVPGIPYASVFPPTIAKQVKPEMALASTEIFGPILPAIEFHEEKEALQIANSTDAGLAAYVFTSDRWRTDEMGQRLEAGMVGINTGVISTEVAPFGGIKQSGLGREGGRLGIYDYLEAKYLAETI